MYLIVGSGSTIGDGELDTSVILNVKISIL